MEKKEKRALILSGIAWNDTIQRHHMVTKELLAKGYQVDFVESVPSSGFTFAKFWNRWAKSGNKRENADVKCDPGLAVYKFPILPGGYCLLDIFNRLFFKFHIKERIERRYDLIVSYLPIRICLLFIENLEHDILVYDCVRNFDGWGGYPRSVKSIEKLLLREADYVLCDSFYLKDKIEQAGRKDVIQVLPSLNTTSPVCLTEKSIGRIKKLIYFGTLSTHVDTALLKELHSSGFEIHFWGKMEGVYAENELSFIVDHGYIRDIEVLLAEINAIGDAVIIPYKGNMDGVIPAKLLQALSLNIPVFTSSFYDTEKLSDLLYVYKNSTELQSLLGAFQMTRHEERQKKIREFIVRNKEGVFFPFL